MQQACWRHKHACFVSFCWLRLCRPPLQAASVIAVDLSPSALAHAAFNAARCGVAAHVRTLQGSWFEPLEGLGLQGKLAGLLSNPPYIPAVQMRGLQAEVARHEPWSALSGGDEAGMASLEVRHALLPWGFLSALAAAALLLVLRLLPRSRTPCPALPCLFWPCRCCVPAQQGTCNLEASLLLR